MNYDALILHATSLVAGFCCSRLYFCLKVMCFLGWSLAAREVSHENNDQHTVSLTRADHAGDQSSPILTPYSEDCVKLQEITYFY